MLSEEHSIHSATKLCKVPVAFDEMEIKLNIPDRGTELEDGWAIYPMYPPVVSFLSCNNLYSLVLKALN